MGSSRPCSRCVRRMAARYTFNVLYDVWPELSTQKNFIVHFSSQCANSKKVTPLWGCLVGIAHLLFHCPNKNTKQLNYEGLSSAT